MTAAEAGSPSPDAHARCRRMRTRNASIAGNARGPALGRDTPIPFLCECDEEACDAYVVLSLRDYDRFRDDHLYLTVPSHVIAAARRVRGADGVDLYAV